MCECVSRSVVSLCSPMDCSPPGSSVQEILQARILERVSKRLGIPGKDRHITSKDLE